MGFFDQGGGFDPMTGIPLDPAMAMPPMQGFGDQPPAQAPQPPPQPPPQPQPSPPSGFMDPMGGWQMPGYQPPPVMGGAPFNAAGVPGPAGSPGGPTPLQPGPSGPGASPLIQSPFHGSGGIGSDAARTADIQTPPWGAGPSRSGPWSQSTDLGPGGGVGGPMSITPPGTTPEAPPPGSFLQRTLGSGLLQGGLGIDPVRARGISASLGAGLTAMGKQPGAMGAFGQGAGAAIQGGLNQHQHEFSNLSTANKDMIQAALSGDRGAYFAARAVAIDAAKNNPAGTKAWWGTDYGRAHLAEQEVVASPEVKSAYMAYQQIMKTGTDDEKKTAREEYLKIVKQRRNVVYPKYQLKGEDAENTLSRGKGPDNPWSVTGPGDSNWHNVLPGHYYTIPSGPKKGELYIRNPEPGQNQAAAAAGTPAATADDYAADHD